jgi:hypothetical protein
MWHCHGLQNDTSSTHGLIGESMMMLIQYTSSTVDSSDAGCLPSITVMPTRTSRLNPHVTVTGSALKQQTRQCRMQLACVRGAHAMTVMACCAANAMELLTPCNAATGATQLWNQHSHSQCTCVQTRCLCWQQQLLAAAVSLPILTIVLMHEDMHAMLIMFLLLLCNPC